MKINAERKGLSQILYLIIAASVLMMIAMVITFTATDTIGGVGGDSKKKQCTGSITGKCTATQGQYIELPSSCTTNNGNPIPAVSQTAGSVPSGSSTPCGGSFTGGTCTESSGTGTGSTSTTYVACPE
jgi:hypothetical protein